MLRRPRRAVRAAADSIERGIERVARILDEMNESRQGINVGIAGLLGMTNVPQTRRMACAIIANALVFHSRIAGMHENVKPLNLVCGPGVSDPQRETLDAWARILDINYWPIFAVGKDILAQLPASEAARVLGTLQMTAGEISAAGMENSHDLTGRVFQRLIADRKYLATFYTLPASAALLARLAVAKMEGVDWSSAEALGKLRIGDFACGTGALLSAVYEQIAARHELTGGDPAALHPVMMEEVLYGCDVMPSAIHISSSTLAGTYPEVEFRGSRLYPLKYGKQADGSVKIGSLELLQSSTPETLFDISDPSVRVTGIGEEPVPYPSREIPHESFDLVIMNPPFTRNTTPRSSIRQYIWRGLCCIRGKQTRPAGHEQADGKTEERDVLPRQCRNSVRLCGVGRPQAQTRGSAGIGIASVGSLWLIVAEFQTITGENLHRPNGR